MDATLETALTKLAELEEDGKARLWAKADLVKVLVDTFGGSVIGPIADVLTCTKAHVKLMARCSEVFSKEVRYPDVPWGIYLQCAQTEKPDFWLSQVVEGRWSIKDLKQAMKESEPQKETSPEEEALSAIHKLAGKLEALDVEAWESVLGELTNTLSKFNLFVATAGDGYEQAEQHNS